jgi:hypothetical protein
MDVLSDFAVRAFSRHVTVLKKRAWTRFMKLMRALLDTAVNLLICKRKRI